MRSSSSSGADRRQAVPGRAGARGDPRDSFRPVRRYIVDPRYHDAYSLNPRLQFLEFIAKNIGILRSRGELILTTNTDVYLGQRVVELIAERSLEPGTLYRATRIDVRLGSDLTHLDWNLFEDSRNWVAVNTITPPLYTNASGDFLLLDRASYCRVRGFNEVYRVAKIHLDGTSAPRSSAAATGSSTSGHQSII
jgi:hypothetical protein